MGIVLAAKNDNVIGMLFISQATNLVMFYEGFIVLDMGSSPTHKGIICRKFEEGMSPPDIARATGHNLDSVDNYLGTYRRIKVLLRKGFDVETICQVTGKAPRTVAEYLVIVEHYQSELVGKDHRDWLMKRRKKVGTVRFLPAETMTPMVTALGKGGSKGSGQEARCC